MAGQGMDYNVDIVMCIDATGSMGPIINTVKANALSFYKKFVEAMEIADKTVDVLRIKVIAFRDIGADANALQESRFFTLPDDDAEFNAFVSGIEAKGGGDIPESALEAIALALKSDWTTGGFKRRHVILLFTDAPALELGTRAGCPGYPAGMPKDLAELGSWWEGTSQELSGTYQPTAGRLVCFAPNAYPWTDIQTWNRYWPAFSAAGDGLADVDIDAAIQLLVGSC